MKVLSLLVPLLWCIASPGSTRAEELVRKSTFEDGRYVYYIGKVPSKSAKVPSKLPESWYPETKIESTAKTNEDDMSESKIVDVTVEATGLDVEDSNEEGSKQVAVLGWIAPTCLVLALAAAAQKRQSSDSSSNEEGDDDCKKNEDEMISTPAPSKKTVSSVVSPKAKRKTRRLTRKRSRKSGPVYGYSHRNKEPVKLPGM